MSRTLNPWKNTVGYTNRQMFRVSILHL